MADEKRTAGETPAPQSADNPHTSFEPSDANIGGIFRAGVVLGVFCVVSMIGLIWLFDLFARRMGGAPGPAPELPSNNMRLPREPRLEGLSSPSDEQQKAIDAERASYGWVNRDRRIARIPIAEAMKMLPSKYPAPEKTTPEEKQLIVERTHPPGPSSSGRIIEGHNGR